MISPADGERRLISAMTASRPSARRRAEAKGGGGRSALARASSPADTARNNGAISRRLWAMISISLSMGVLISRKESGKAQGFMFCFFCVFLRPFPQ